MYTNEVIGAARPISNRKRRLWRLAVGLLMLVPIAGLAPPAYDYVSDASDRTK
jgi:hypothetical protein